MATRCAASQVAIHPRPVFPMYRKVLTALLGIGAEKFSDASEVFGGVTALFFYPPWRVFLVRRQRDADKITRHGGDFPVGNLLPKGEALRSFLSAVADSFKAASREALAKTSAVAESQVATHPRPISA